MASSQSKRTSLLTRTVRFGFTGLFVTGLHVVIATLFIHLISPSPPLANGVAFCCATLVSYLMHTTWSFSGQLHGRTLFRFITVSIIGLLLSMLVSWAIQQLGLGYFIGIAAVVLVLPPVNFLLHNFWTYR